MSHFMCEGHVTDCGRNSFAVVEYTDDARVEALLAAAVMLGTDGERLTKWSPKNGDVASGR